MNKKQKVVLVLMIAGVLLLILQTIPIFADTIILKNGNTREGKIVERTDNYVKIDLGNGIVTTYFIDSIDSIEGEKISTSQTLLNPALSDATKESLDKETSPITQEKQKIEDMLHAFWGYECNFVYDENQSAVSENYNNPAIEKARKLIDWDNYEVEPKNSFQFIYKMALNEQMKTIAQRNILTARFTSAKASYEKAGLVRRLEDYKVREININDSFDDATVVYVNATGEKKLKVHKKDGRWFIYRDCAE